MQIAGGPIFQLAWVVDDIEAAQEHVTGAYGVARWFSLPGIEFGPDTCTYRGRPASYTIDISLGYAGGQQLELIRPVTGDNLYTEFLARFGPGLHHIAWVPDDFDAALAAAARCGLAILQEGSFPGVGMRFAYLDGGPTGTYVELMGLSADMRAMFDHLVPEGYRNPWQ